jgi:hypothetical protein
MEMHDVKMDWRELAQHHHASHRVPNRTVETEARGQIASSRRRVGISAGEQRDVVSSQQVLFGQPQMTFGTTACFGGTTSVSGDICAIRMHTPDAARGQSGFGHERHSLGRTTRFVTNKTAIVP